MNSQRLIALALAAIINTTSSIAINREKVQTEDTFEPTIVQSTDNVIEENNEEEQERLAYEEYLRQEEYKRQNPEFTKYDLSEYELKSIARLCQQEQGTPKGAAAEASLMANLYELYGGNYSSIYSYVKNSGWFYKSSYFMSLIDSLDKDTLEVVYQVLILGKRTLPKYIDNHDGFDGIKYINTGNKFCREDYIPGETKIQNYSGANYTFYCFPDETSDPFGYNDPANIEKYGDACYDVDRVLKKEFLQ